MMPSAIIVLHTHQIKERLCPLLEVSMQPLILLYLNKPPPITVSIKSGIKSSFEPNELSNYRLRAKSISE